MREYRGNSSSVPALTTVKASVRIWSDAGLVSTDHGKAPCNGRLTLGVAMEDEALRVIRVLIDHGCEPGPDYPDELSQIWFAEAGLNDAETERGLIAAHPKGWIIMPSDRPGWFRITQA